MCKPRTPRREQRVTPLVAPCSDMAWLQAGLCSVAGFNRLAAVCDPESAWRWSGRGLQTRSPAPHHRPGSGEAARSARPGALPRWKHPPTHGCSPRCHCRCHTESLAFGLRGCGSEAAGAPSRQTPPPPHPNTSAAHRRRRHGSISAGAAVVGPATRSTHRIRRQRPQRHLAGPPPPRRRRPPRRSRLSSPHTPPSAMCWWRRRTRAAPRRRRCGMR